MSDLSIPGVTTGKVDTKRLVDAAMEPDRARLKSKEAELQQIRDQKTVWQDVKQRLSQVETNARNLFGAQNPFREKKADSSDASVLTATATRDADPEKHEIRVLQTASVDRFLSDPVDRDFRAPAGTYRFRVGDDEARVAFRGGSLAELVDTINRGAGKLVEARLVRVSEKTLVLSIEAKKPGAANALSLLDAAADLGTGLGILAASGRQLAAPPLAAESAATPPDPRKVLFADGAIDLKPGGEVTLPFPAGQTLTPDIELQVRLKVTSFAEEPYKTPSPPPGPRIPSSGRAQYQGNTVENESPELFTPPWKPPEAPRRTDDFHVVGAVSQGTPVALPPVEPRDGEQTLRMPIGRLAPNLESLTFSNRNTHREIVVSEVRLVDPSVRGDYKPKNPRSQAQDAVVELDGIRVTRPTNQIDDLLTGVNLTLHKPGDKPVNLEIAPNAEATKNAIIQFVGNYNQLLGRVDVLTRNDEQVVADLTYLTDEERAKARQQLGLLQGDLALNQMKSRMREIVAGAYPTSAGRDLALLAQIGVGTDASRPGSGIDKSRLRGYLEIDEDRLQGALNNRTDAVRQLFGNDTDGDFVVDSGVAFSLVETLHPYLTAGGLIGTRITTIDQTAGRRERDIATLAKQLQDKEAKLERDFATMQGALNNLSRSSSAIDNFSRGAGGGR
jgi:flagellar hook-associated protein 2